MSCLTLSVLGCMVLLTITIVQSHVMRDYEEDAEITLDVQLASDQCREKGYPIYCATSGKHLCDTLLCAHEDLVARAVGKPINGTNCTGYGTACYLGQCVVITRRASSKPRYERGRYCNMDGVALD